MSEHTEALSPEDFSDLVEWKAAQRRQDAEDIAAGLRTPEEIRQENTRWLILAPMKLSSSTSTKRMKLFELTDYGAVIRAAEAAGLDLVLVGGQAVGLYAARYFSACTELAQFQPFVSKDADLLGSIDDGFRLASALNTRWEQNPRKGGMQGLSLGKLTLTNPSDAKVEILGRILGASASEVRTTAIRAEVPGIGHLKVINPVLLYTVKGNNLVRLLQRETGRERQDGRQFMVMEIVVTSLLKRLSLETPAESARALVKTCGRLIEFWLSVDGAALVGAGAASPSKVLPSDAMQRHESQSVRNLVEKRLPVFFEQQLPAAVSATNERTLEKIRADLSAVAPGT